MSFKRFAVTVGAAYAMGVAAFLTGSLYATALEKLTGKTIAQILND